MRDADIPAPGAFFNLNIFRVRPLEGRTQALKFGAHVVGPAWRPGFAVHKNGSSRQHGCFVFEPQSVAAHLENTAPVNESPHRQFVMAETDQKGQQRNDQRDAHEADGRANRPAALL